MLKKVVRAYFGFIRPPIIQFSPPRTGSTLLWNTLRVSFPAKKVLKQHKLLPHQKSWLCRSDIVVSVRNPLDSIASLILRYGQEVSDEVVRNNMTVYENEGALDVVKLVGKKRALILKYEDFAGKFDYLFEQLEVFFKTDIPEDVKKEVIRDFSIDVVKKKSEKLQDFGNYDESDHIHGRHISKFSGASGYYKNVFTQHQIEMVYSNFKELFDLFGYSSPLVATEAHSL